MITFQKNKHVNSLDGIRGMAVILIMLHHGCYGFFNAGIGVTIFFALSAYLITTLIQFEYQKTGNFSFKNFYIRRFLRLYPALILGVILGNILWPYTKQSILTLPSDRILATFSSIFYFSNFVKNGLNMSHHWTLSIEEQFYIFWPIAMYYFFLKMSIKKVLIILSIILLIDCIAIFLIWQYYPDPSPDSFLVGFFHNKLFIFKSKFTFFNINAMILGASISFLKYSNQGDKFFSKRAINDFIFFILLIFIVGVITKFDFGRFLFSKIIPYYDILSAFFIVFAINNPNYFLLSNKFIRWFGTRSYGIYLYHIPIFLFLEKFRVSHNILNLVLITFSRFGITFVLAEISYRFIESPILRLKEKFTSH